MDLSQSTAPLLETGKRHPLNSVPRTCALLLGLATVAMGCWSSWSDWPEFAAPGQIVTPLIALWLAAIFPDDLTLGPLDRTDPDRRGSLFLAMVFAMLGLAIGAWREFRYLDIDMTVGWFVAAALVAGGLFTIAALRIDKRQLGDLPMHVVASAAAALWAAGMLLELNGHLPGRGFTQTPVEVADKQIWRGGRGGTSYHLFLKVRHDAAAAPMTVRQSLFDRTTIGAHLCLIHTTGTLTIRWWQVSDCRMTIETHR